MTAQGLLRSAYPRTHGTQTRQVPSIALHATGTPTKYIIEYIGVTGEGENVEKSRRWSVNSGLVSRSNYLLSIQSNTLKALGLASATKR